MFEKIKEWWNSSHRKQHYELGVVIGLCANDLHSAGYLGVCVGGSLEFKDCQYNNDDKPIKYWDWSAWDWTDFLLTFAGVMTGYTIRYLFLKLW